MKIYEGGLGNLGVAVYNEPEDTKQLASLLITRNLL